MKTTYPVTLMTDLLQTIFENGKLLVDDKLADIRERLQRNL